MMAGLFDGFEGHRAPGDAELTDALDTALVSLDANVLLGFYRYPEEFGTALIDELSHYGDRVFVSHQALAEFWRNRTSALADRARAKSEAEKQLSSNERSTSNAIEQWGKKVALEDADLDQARAIVARQFELLTKLVEDAHADDREIYPSTDQDPIVKSLERLLSGRVGAPLSDDEWRDAVDEGKRRHREQIPPGYKEKPDEKERLAEGVSGDYLVWLQSIQAASVRGLDLLILTSDVKEDWYARFRDDIIGPRQELAKEYWDLSGKRLFLMRPSDLIQRAAARGGHIGADALDEAARQLEGETDTRDREPDPVRAAPWTQTNVTKLLALLDQQAHVQADVIRAAARNGGRVERDEVYQIGGYSPDRMLRGFTRPVRRLSRVLQEAGELDVRAPEMLTPRYDYSVEANAFQIPDQVVAILRGEA